MFPFAVVVSWHSVTAWKMPCALSNSSPVGQPTLVNERTRTKQHEHSGNRMRVQRERERALPGRPETNQWFAQQQLATPLP
jgi:hypothetical protein